MSTPLELCLRPFVSGIAWLSGEFCSPDPWKKNSVIIYSLLIFLTVSIAAIFEAFLPLAPLSALNHILKSSITSSREWFELGFCCLRCRGTRQGLCSAYRTHYYPQSNSFPWGFGLVSSWGLSLRSFSFLEYFSCCELDHFSILVWSIKVTCFLMQKEKINLSFEGAQVLNWTQTITGSSPRGSDSKLWPGPYSNLHWASKSWWKVSKEFRENTQNALQNVGSLL